MLCSNKKEERVFAVDKILKIRGKNALGNTKPRPRKTPEIFSDGVDLTGLISWDNANEPLMTCSLSNTAIISFKEVPMEVLYFCLHTQGIERAVKEVSVVIY